MSRYRPILIVSPPRSGSSMVARLCDMAGAFGGVCKEGDQYNPHGYYENLYIRDLLIRYLRLHDHQGLGKQFQPTDLDVPYPGFAVTVTNELIWQGYLARDQDKWYFKDPKLCLTWRMWNEAFPQAVWVLLERNSDAVLDSFHRCPFMDAYKYRIEWEWMLDRYKEMQQQLCRTVQYAKWFSSDKIAAGNIEELNRLSQWTALPITGSAVDSNLFTPASE